MKKLLLGLLVFLGTLLSAQYGPNNGWGNNNNGYYDDRDDEYYFPEDYYYEYPTDYYSDAYYQDFYGDYRRSIEMINWNRFFREYALTTYQINMIMDLNRQFESFAIWNSYYRMNPVRWYYDRFYALERIMGPRIFMVFQNRYYNGYAPVVYYNNRCRDWYRPRYAVIPRYRNININIYRVDRRDYHRSTGNHYGWNQPRNHHNTGGFRNDDGRRNSIRNSDNRNTPTRANSGIRNSENSFPRNNSGIRNSENSTPRSNSGIRNHEVYSNPRTGVIRNTTPRNTGTQDSGIRNQTPRSSQNRSIRNSDNAPRNTAPRSIERGGSRSSERNSGTRSGSSVRTRLTSN